MAALAPWIFDGAFLAVLLIFLILGAKRGFVLTLCSLLAVFVAFGGATFAARTLSPKVGAAIQPKIQQTLEQRLNDELHGAVDGIPTQAPGDLDASPAPSPTPAAPPYNAPTGGDEDGLGSVLDAIRGLGFYEAVVDSIRDSVEEGLGQAASSVAASAAAELAASIAYLVLFIVFFILILLAWLLLSHVLDLVARLPVLSTLNRVGGALIGLAKGCIILFVAAFILQFSGNLIPEAVARQTILLNFFLTANPITAFFGL